MRPIFQEQKQSPHRHFGEPECKYGTIEGIKGTKAWISEVGNKEKSGKQLQFGRTGNIPEQNFEPWVRVWGYPYKALKTNLINRNEEQ